MNYKTFYKRFLFIVVSYCILVNSMLYLLERPTFEEVKVAKVICAENVGEGQYTTKEICNNIYIIEGKDKARQPFGIETIECKTFEKCEQICHNTINNNKKRFKNQNKEDEFLIFLAKRYCPPNWKIWLKNLKYYLNKDE